jgi:DNA processing protein
MTRNQVIVGLSRALVVVEAGPTGGTLRAGELAIQAERPLLVLGFAGGDPEGNTKLLAAGGRRISDRAQLGSALRKLRSTGSAGQLALE